MEKYQTQIFNKTSYCPISGDNFYYVSSKCNIKDWSFYISIFPPSICLFSHLSVYYSHLFVSFSPSICLFSHLSVYFSIYLSIFSIYLSIFSIYLSIFSTYLSIFSPICLFFPIYLSIS